MARWRLPPGAKLIFWVAFGLLFLAYTLAPVYMAPVPPPIP